MSRKEVPRAALLKAAVGGQMNNAAVVCAAPEHSAGAAGRLLVTAHVHLLLMGGWASCS